MQDAILHNKRIFEQRLLSEDRALQRRVLYAWQSVVQWTTAKHARLVRAQGRLKRGLLLRVFFSWKSELHLVDRTLEMKRKVCAPQGDAGVWSRAPAVVQQLQASAVCIVSKHKLSL